MSRKLLLQVTAPAVLIGCVTVGVCLASLWSISRLQANLNSILAENVASLEAAADLEVKLRHLRFHTFLYVMDPTPARGRTIADAEAGFETALAAARRSARPADAELVAAIEAGYRRYRADRPGPADLTEAVWSRRAYLDWADAHPVQPLLDQCQELIDRNRAAMEETARESERVSDRSRGAMTALAVLGPIGGLVAGFGITRGLSRSIARLRVRVEDVRAKLAQDVATVRVEGDGFRGLDAGLDEVVVRVRDVVEQAQRRERDGLRAEQLAAVGQLAAGVAHEVRNPLMAVKLLVESALAGGELTADDLRVIHGEIGRLEQTVTGLLDFARPGALRREPTDVRGIAASAAELVAGRAAFQQVRVELEAPAAPILAHVDAAQLRGVLVNLLLNALDALPGGGRVTVAVEARDVGAVRLTVKDTGSGIAPAILGRLFEPFASTKDTGTGLGLNVCRRVVRDHGGDIRWENRPGGGAVFTIDLPGGPPCRRLLVIDDEPAVGYSFQRAFAPSGVEVVTARTGAAGIERFRTDPPDAVVLDVRLPDRSGLDVYRELRAIDPRRPVVVITAHGTTETAIEATKEGAFEYLLKPVDFARMKDVLARAFAAARLQPTPTVLPDEAAPDRIVGRSRAVAEMCKLIGRAAPQDVHVLILGESGTGKGLVARAVYQHSKRAARPFVAVTCATVSDADLTATGGTLFLDEIGDLTPAAQAKLLSHLQVQADTRVLAATNADLDGLVAAGRFRKDLYYRLRGVTIRVPPLRERGSDVAELANHFLFRFNRETGLDFRGLAPEVLELFEAYPWPGNVRELQGAIRQAMLAGPGHLILPDALPPELRGRPMPAVNPPATMSDLDVLIADALTTAPGDVYTHVLRAVEARLFPAALARTQGNQVQASELLGLHRATLRHKLRSLGINVEKTVAKPD